MDRPSRLSTWYIVWNTAEWLQEEYTNMNSHRFIEYALLHTEECLSHADDTEARSQGRR